MDKEAAEYIAEGDRWALDRVEHQRGSARRAWLVAVAALLVAVCASAAVFALSPLKRVEPFLIRVDNSTGLVDVVPLYAGTADLPEVVTRHLVSEYVAQRERYIPALAETDYEQIGAYHSAQMNQAWAGMWSRTNPDSPLVRYGDSTQVTTAVEAVSFLKRTVGGASVVQVRFSTNTQRTSGAANESASFLATIEIGYGKPSTDTRMRALNPLGFKVTEYHREPVVAPVDAGGHS